MLAARLYRGTIRAVLRPAMPAALAMWRRGMADTIKIPEMGDSISEGTILSLMKGPGDYVGAEETVAEIETDKVTVEAKSPQAGTIKEIFVAEGDNVEVGSNFFSIDVGVGEAPAVSAAAPAAAPAASASSAPAPAPTPTPSPPKAAAPTPAVAPKSEPAGELRERRVKMSRMRQRIAVRLKEAQNEAAMLTTFNEVDMSGLTNLRNEYKDAFLKKHDVKLGFMSPFVAAAARALQEQPAVNAVIDDGTKEIVYRDYVDISVAVSSPTGLVVPVLRGVEGMSFADIERNIALLGNKAKNGDLTVEDMAGGTFSITNGGVFGSLMSTPIINPPQSAILGMHGIFPRPIAVKGEVVIRPMMYIALTYDHRLVDGREAVTALKRIKELVENPARFLLEC